MRFSLPAHMSVPASPSKPALPCPWHARCRTAPEGKNPNRACPDFRASFASVLCERVCEDGRSEAGHLPLTWCLTLHAGSAGPSPGSPDRKPSSFQLIALSPQVALPASPPALAVGISGTTRVGHPTRHRGRRTSTSTPAAHLTEPEPGHPDQVVTSSRHLRAQRELDNHTSDNHCQEVPHRSPTIMPNRRQGHLFDPGRSCRMTP